MATDRIDETDRRILQELQRDGRLTLQQLSERVNLSSSPCARRIKKLESEGFITGYRALISEEKMGFGFSVFVSVTLDQQIDDRLVSFEAEVERCPEVADCWLMTGRFDYLLRLTVIDMAEYERFLTHRLTKFPGVASIESSIPIRRVKGQVTRLR